MNCAWGKERKKNEERKRGGRMEEEEVMPDKGMRFFYEHTNIVLILFSVLQQFYPVYF